MGQPHEHRQLGRHGIMPQRDGGDRSAMGADKFNDDRALQSDRPYRQKELKDPRAGSDAGHRRQH